MLNFFNKGIRTVYTLMLSTILILLLFYSSTEYMCKTEFLCSNIFISACILILFASLLMIWSASGNVRKKFVTVSVPYKKIVYIAALCLFIGQLYLSYNIYFFPGWDAGTVYKAAKTVAFGDVSQLNNNYFSIYPNNLFLTSVYAVILKINRAVGVLPAEHQLLSLIILNCLCSTAACVLIYKILCKFLNEKYAFMGFCLGVIAFGCSPWVTVCYSDSAGLLFPILLLWLYLQPVNVRRKKIMRFIFIVLVCVIGYSVKPQTIIIIIAAVFAEFIYMLKENAPKKIAKKAVWIFVGLLMASALLHVFDRLYEREGFVLNDEAAYGMSHFFMMGLNEDRNGVFAEEDTSFSKSFQTKAERRNANLKVAADRLKNFGIIGYGKHLAKKLLVTYHDGTYAWGQEGNFFKKYNDKVNTKPALFLRSIYYPGGRYYNTWATASQAVWLMIIILCFFSGLLLKENDCDSAKIYSVLYLSVVGLTVFELLFECRARYLYTYVPIFCMNAVFGICALRRKTVKIIEKIKIKKEKQVK